jgi:transposase
MRYFQPPAATRFYAGVDLHARSLFLCLLDRDGEERCARNLPAAPAPFLKAVQPVRDGLVVGCECMHCWYWLADTCRDQDIAFVLGRAWGMRAVHGSKTTCDRHDAQAIARLLKGGNFPLAYAYPKERRGLRDLLRARLRLVRQRAELYGHIHTARRQADLPPVSSDVKYQSKRGAITADIADPFVRRRVEADLALLEPLDTTIRRLEAETEEAARQHYPAELAVLQTTPGVGPVLSLTILLEIDTIDRFATRQQFCSYARLCGAVQESDGKRGRRRQPQGRQRLAEVGLLRGRRAVRPEGRARRPVPRPAGVPAGQAQGAVGLGPQAGPGLLPHAPHEGGLRCQPLREALSHGAAGEPEPNGRRRGQPQRRPTNATGLGARRVGLRPQPRQPDALMGRRLRPPSPPTAVASDRAAARGWVGGRNEIGARPSH